MSPYYGGLYGDIKALDLLWILCEAVRYVHIATYDYLILAPFSARDIHLLGGGGTLGGYSVCGVSYGIRRYVFWRGYLALIVSLSM